MKTKNKNRYNKHIRLLSRQGIIAASLVFLMSFSIASFSLVKADQFEEQIKALSQQNNIHKSEQAQLGAEASSLSDVISKLQNEINAKQAQINAHQAEIEKLKAEIAAAEIELAKQKRILGEAIKVMYLEDEISPVEMLAVSKDLSDFFDKQQYRESVRAKVKTTLDKVTQLKLDLNTRKDKTEKLLAEQQLLKDQLLAQRNEQNRLLSLNQAEQSKVNQNIKANNAQIAELRKQQAAANAKLFRGVKVIAGSNGRDTYPDKWRNAPQDSMVDSWGMYNRECVSYTAWKVYESGRHMPYWGGRGNANLWDDNARAAGIPVDTNPRPGDVAVSNSGFYGHVMYVESVNSNGTINVSQYNWGLDGTYSEAYNLSRSGLVFIHF